jgi:hypothetical protein
VGKAKLGLPDPFKEHSFIFSSLDQYKDPAIYIGGAPKEKGAQRPLLKVFGMVKAPFAMESPPTKTA